MKPERMTQENGWVRPTLGFLPGAIIDLLLFYFFLGSGLTWTVAHLVGFAGGALATYLLWTLWLLRCNPRKGAFPDIPRYLVIQLFAVFLRSGVLAVLIQVVSWSPKVAILLAAGTSSTVSLIGIELSIFCKEKIPGKRSKHWSMITVAAICYAVMLRLLCGVSLELIHEEGYYWNYAQHLDIGYLDHPPMVGWLIWIFTSALGQAEFAVRAGSFLCWFVTAYYVYKLADAVCDKQAALGSLLLVAVLPAFFGFGFVMTPDAPLIACWAGALYYLYRLVIEGRNSSWLGLGIFMGIGMLSKYTIVLLGCSAFVFVLFNSHYRRLLFRPGPYLTLLLVIALFSPVVIWNANHEWVSFTFQSTSRTGGNFDFDLPDLIGSLLFLLTPAGLLSAIVVFTSGKLLSSGTAYGEKKSAYRFLITTTVFPLSIFVLFSLFRSTKINWTAPVWLGILPYMAVLFITNNRDRLGKLAVYATRAWPLTIATVLLLYGALLYYLSLGFPGIPYPQNFPGIGSEDLARQIETIVNTFEKKTGEKPLVVYMDEDKMAGLIAFYRTKISGNSKTEDIVDNTTGGHFFGKESHMYRYWHPIEKHRKRIIVLIGFKADHMVRTRVRLLTEPISDVKQIVAFKNGKVTGRYFYQFQGMDGADYCEEVR
jgi:dolichol-phosphate mannosyltransferase